MARLAIKGHATRGKEVIEILEMLGGTNRKNCWGVFKNRLYLINTSGDIEDISLRDKSIYKIYTIEEFLEKFPYKVGDKVSSKYLKNYKIEKMEWEDTNNRVIYKLQGMGWYSAEELQPYKEETMDKANKAVFDVNAQCCDIMNRIIKKKAMEEIIKIDIPKGYEFAGVDDDNQQVVFEKIGYQYPRTYEECCDVLKIPNDERYIDIDVPLGYNKLLSTFTKLLICRNAYWKIAGDWKPDWEYGKLKYGLIVSGNWVRKQKSEYVQMKFCFPNEEMRDAFYENFKDLIEECKELL